MSEVYDDLDLSIKMGRVWQGKIASTPADYAIRVMVTIPDLDPKLQIGPCRWQSRGTGTLPIRGDRCLVIFDNDREPWVVAWWPFTT